MLTLQIRNMVNLGVMSCLGQGGLRSLSVLANILSHFNSNMFAILSNMYVQTYTVLW